MSLMRTKATQSESKRDVFANDQPHGRQEHARAGRVTRAESLSWRPRLEFIRLTGGSLKWGTLYFGGESRAGEEASAV